MASLGDIGLVCGGKRFVVVLGRFLVVSGWLEVIYIYKWRFGWYKAMFVVVSGFFSGGNMVLGVYSMRFGVMFGVVWGVSTDPNRLTRSDAGQLVLLPTRTFTRTRSVTFKNLFLIYFSFLVIFTLLLHINPKLLTLFQSYPCNLLRLTRGLVEIRPS